MVKEYYKILELSENCSQTDIKKHYKKMALKWHPDRNKENKDVAEEKFKKVSEAYEVLSNEDKRRKYDKFGTLDVSEISHVNPNDIFQQMFGQQTGGFPFNIGQNPLEQFMFNMGQNVMQQSKSQSISMNQFGQRVLRTETQTTRPNGSVQIQIQEQVIG